MNITRSGAIVIVLDEKHRRGASASCAMSHTAVADAKHGKVVDRLEPVVDAKYAGRPADGR